MAENDIIRDVTNEIQQTAVYLQHEEEREWIVTRGWRSWTIHYLTVLPDYGIAVLLKKQSVNNIFT
jgi:hypothetical protein